MGSLRAPGLRDGVYTVRVSTSLSGAASTPLDADLARIGGSYSWYGLASKHRLTV
jgi:hypothetical protein